MTKTLEFVCEIQPEFFVDQDIRIVATMLYPELYEAHPEYSYLEISHFDRTKQVFILVGERKQMITGCIVVVVFALSFLAGRAAVRYVKGKHPLW